MSNRTIVFLAANCSYSHTNTADWYLRASTADLGWDWHTVEMQVREEPYPTYHRIAELKPDVIAATFYVFNHKMLLSVLNRYKAAHPECVIIGGGPEFLGKNQRFFPRGTRNWEFPPSPRLRRAGGTRNREEDTSLKDSESLLDAVVRGEGEERSTSNENPPRPVGTPPRRGSRKHSTLNIQHPTSNDGGRDCGEPLFDAVVRGEGEERSTSNEDPPRPVGTPPGRGSRKHSTLNIQHPTLNEGGEPLLDAVVRGEGEIAFRKMMESIDDRDTWKSIPGVCGVFDGEYVDNGMAEIAKSLDDILSPFEILLQGVDADLRAASDRARRSRSTCCSSSNKPYLHVESSRGCRNTCGFCVSPGQKVRYLSIDRLRSDLKAIREVGIKGIRMIDRTFNDKPSRCVELLNMFRDEFSDMHFHLEIDPSLVTDKVLDAMGRAPAGDSEEAVRVSRYGTGKVHLDVGVQSFDVRVLERCGRKMGASKLETPYFALRATKGRRNLKLGENASSVEKGLATLCGIDAIEVHADLIAGLPGQTIDTVFDDLRKLVSFEPMEIQLELLKVLPGTRFDCERDELGLLASPEPPYEVIRTSDMSEADLEKAIWLSKLVDWFYAPLQLRPVIMKANEVAGFWKELVEFCMAKDGLWMKPSLVNRFRLLSDFFSQFRVPPARRSLGEGGSSEFRTPLAYASVKSGLSGADICESVKWNAALPEDAVLVEGDADAEIATWLKAELDGDYFFGFAGHRNRGAVVVYAKTAPA